MPTLAERVAALLSEIQSLDTARPDHIPPLHRHCLAALRFTGQRMTGDRLTEYLRRTLDRQPAYPVKSVYRACADLVRWGLIVNDGDQTGYYVPRQS